jgi:hypothetical protein
LAQCLQVPVLITTTSLSWDYVIDAVAVHTALLAGVTVSLQYALSNLSPLCCAAITLQCTAHQ